MPFVFHYTNMHSTAYQCTMVCYLSCIFQVYIYGSGAQKVPVAIVALVIINQYALTHQRV